MTKEMPRVLYRVEWADDGRNYSTQCSHFVPLQRAKEIATELSMDGEKYRIAAYGRIGVVGKGKVKNGRNSYKSRDIGVSEQLGEDFQQVRQSKPGNTGRWS